MRLILTFLAAVAAVSASALNVVFDERTPQNLRDWADRCYIREQMEVVAKRLCKALYGDTERSRLHEETTIILNLSPKKGGNPAFASGRRLTWKVGENPGDGDHPGMGLLCHEMTHILDMGSDGVFTEGMADWTRNYKVWYPGCTSPSAILDKRYKALRGGRNYGKYMSGANFIDFMTQNYGEGTILRILRGYQKDGKHHWEKTFGKNLDGLIAEWRRMETIYDPVFQWSYNGTAAGIVRKDKKHCKLSSISASDAKDGTGAWLEGTTPGEVATVKDGSISICLHGWFPNSGKSTAIASLGAPKEGTGKAIVLVATGKANLLAACVVAQCPGVPCQIVSTTKIPVADMAARAHSVVLSVGGAERAVVVVDGAEPVKIDMAAKCKGCTFTPKFAVGGVNGAIGVGGISEAKGEKSGVRLDDVRVFNRAFRERETKLYSDTFNAAFSPSVAVAAEWTGKAGGADVDSPDNWYCVNSIGEKIVALPTKDTDVRVYGKKLPCIGPSAKFKCKSFTIAGFALIESNIDLRGAGVVDVEDNTRIITKGGHILAVSKLRGNRLRLDGMLAVTTAFKLDGKFEMKGGSVLRLPADPAAAFVGELAFSGKGNVFIKPGATPPKYRTVNVMRAGKLPEDLSRISLHGVEDPSAAEFRLSPDKKFLAVYLRK